MKARSERKTTERSRVAFPVKVRLWFYGSFVLLLIGYGFFTMSMPGRSRDRAPSSREELDLAKDTRATIELLAHRIGERRIEPTGSLGRARDALRQRLQERLRSGERVELEPLGEVGQFADNLVVEFGPTDAKGIVVVGAHYDSATMTPGANDNASGVAVALIVAQRLSAHPVSGHVRLVLFANEEPPYFQTPAMGSWIHARRARERGDRITAMLSLETLGYYTNEPKSQKYPFPIDLFYPDRGNFLAFVGNLGSRGLVRRAIGIFRERVAFPSEGAALPETFPGIGWSDHWAFWQEGFPAIMLTDTATYRDPNYHQPSDRGDVIDHEALARIALGVEAIVRDLAANE